MPDVPEPRTRRRLSAAERRARILAAAQEVFARSGYHGSSLDEIAQVSGTSKALIYEHFPSKRDLHDTLLAEHAGILAERFGANAARQATGEERLRSGVDAFFAWVQERPEAWRALFRDAADPDLAPMIDRLQRQAAVAVVAMLADDDGAGRPPDETIEMFAHLTSGAAQALANWWVDGHLDDVPREVLVERFIQFCWLGMERVRG